MRLLKAEKADQMLKQVQHDDMFWFWSYGFCSLPSRTGFGEDSRQRRLGENPMPAGPIDSGIGDRTNAEDELVFWR